MSNPAIASLESGLAALMVMGFMRSLITESSRESLSRVDLLVVIDNIMNDPEIFTPETLEQFAAIEEAEPA